MPRTIIVIPCYNENARLDTREFQRFANQRAATDFLFVDDGSRDGTGEVLTKLKQSLGDRCEVLTLPTNQGKAEAVRQGMRLALSRGAAFAGYWDADLATPLAAIPAFEAVLAADDQKWLVMGSRVRLLGRQIVRRWPRHYLGRVFATLASMTLGVGVYDTQCGAKLFRDCAATRTVFEKPFGTRWLFDVEILARLIIQIAAEGREPDATIFELPLEKWRDVAGSKLRPRDFVRAIFALAWIYRDYGPARLAARRAKPTTVFPPSGQA